MTKLTCNANGCVNNMGGYCTARYIDINIKQENEKDKDLIFCSTFGERNLVEALREFGNVNLGGAIEQALNPDEVVLTPFVNCIAYKCLYNDNGRCEAKNVMIASLNKEGTKPYCETYE